MAGKMTLGRIGVLVGAVLAIGALAPAMAFAQADLSITKTDSADPVSVGAEFDYSITVSNAGPEAANGVSVEDTLPHEVDFVSATASPGTCDTQGSKRVNCDIGTLASGGSATVTIRVRAARAGQATNEATVSATSPNDPTPANNQATQQTTIQEGPVLMCAGQPVTIPGTAGPDTLTGTDQRDVISGLAGDDVISGLDGRDIICGGLGNDAIRGLGDADVVKGGSGDDRVRGGEGDDTLAGNGANDNIGGGAGDDALRGGPGTDRCSGGPGRDTRRGCE